MTGLITESDVRESIAVARSHGEKFFEQIVWQVENEVWTVLGYASWDELRQAEYADMGVVAPRADRPELTSRLRSKGLTQQEIAATLGVDRKTVRADLLNGENGHSETITNSRGHQRPSSYQRKPQSEVDQPGPLDGWGSASDTLAADEDDQGSFECGDCPEDGFSVEVWHCPGCAHHWSLNDDECRNCHEWMISATGLVQRTADPDDEAGQPPRKRPRPALPDTFWRARFDLGKKVESLHRLTEDDRWPTNKKKIAEANLNDLLRARDLLEQVIALLQNNTLNTKGS